jgi:hypothetical protein
MKFIGYVENRKKGRQRERGGEGYYYANYIQLDGPSSSAKQNIFVFG